MAQAERVADLVHRHVLGVALNEGFGLGAVGVEIAACLEHVECIAKLLGRGVGVTAGLEGAHAAQAQLFGQRAGVGVGGWRRHQNLRAQGAQVARRQALDADVGVEDLAGSRVDMAGPDRTERRAGVGHPAQRVAAEVERVPGGIVALHLDTDRVLEADLLEGLVPLEHTGGNGRPVLHRNVAVEPEDDGLDRLGQLGRRVLLLKAPTVDVALTRRAREVVAEVRQSGREVADAAIGHPRRHHLLGQLGDGVVQRHEHAARVGHGAWRRRHRRSRWHRRAGGRHGDGAGGVVAQHFQHHQIGCRPHLGDRRVARVEGIALTVLAL